MVTSESALSLGGVGNPVLIEEGTGDVYEKRMRLGVEQRAEELGGVVDSGGVETMVRELMNKGVVGLEKSSLMKASRELYELAQRWVRHDYKGFMRWLREGGEVGEPLAEMVVRTLNIGDDGNLAREVVIKMAGELKRRQIVDDIAGTEALWTMIDRLAQEEAGDSGDQGSFNPKVKRSPSAAPAVASPPPPSLPGGENGDDKKGRDEKEKKVTRVGGEKKIGGWFKRRADSSKRKDLSRSSGTSRRRAIASFGCLILAFGACCAASVAGAWWAGNSVVADWQKRSETGEIVDSRFESVAGIKKGAEYLVEVMFWEDGWESDATKIEDPGRGEGGAVREFVDFYRRHAREGDELSQQAYGDSLLFGLRNEGLAVGGDNFWEGEWNVDREGVEERLKGEGYPDQDINDLLELVNSYLAQRDSLRNG